MTLSWSRENVELNVDQGPVWGRKEHEIRWEHLGALGLESTDLPPSHRRPQGAALEGASLSEIFVSLPL